MKLSEKILSLRTARGLSQGDLAEKLDVSRQSVSKWETGQSVPDLDKIIKIADLFGVSVDELVREGEKPEPTKAEPQVVYVQAKKEYRPWSALVCGVIAEALALVLLVLGLAGVGSAFVLLGLILLVAGLPLLLVKKYPWLVCGWMIVILWYVIMNPWWTSGGMGLLYTVENLLRGHLRRIDLLVIFRFGMLVGVIAATWFTLRRKSKQKDEYPDTGHRL